MSPTSPTRIALVEDDPHVRDGITRVLATVSEWPLVAVADRLAATQGWDFSAIDLLLLDLNLPDGSGLSLLPRCPTTCQVLVISALGDEASVMKALEHGASGYLLKEAQARELVSAIQAVLDGGAPISPGVAHHLLKRMRKPRSNAGAPTGKSLDELTPREAEVLRVLTRGYSYDEAARLLGISRHTVGQHIKQIYAKLAVNSRSEAVYEAIQAGWLDGQAG